MMYGGPLVAVATQVAMMNAERIPAPNGVPLFVNRSRSVSATGVVRPGVLPVGLEAGALRRQGNALTVETFSATFIPSASRTHRLAAVVIYTRRKAPL